MAATFDLYSNNDNYKDCSVGRNLLSVIESLRRENDGLDLTQS